MIKLLFEICFILAMGVAAYKMFIGDYGHAMSLTLIWIAILLNDIWNQNARGDK